MRELIAELASGLRERVLPQLGSHAGRAHARAAEGGDVTFEIDAAAEDYLEDFVARRAPDTAFYSEDRGLVEPAARAARWVLVVDPIDGTRPALAGFESACVSVALASLESEPTIGDVEIGCVQEIKSGDRFLAQRGRGVEATRPLRLSRNSSLSRLFWVYGLRGRPARQTIEVLAELIDRSSVGGATFDLGSATYDMTRILTGQLDAYVEPSPRLVEEVPGMRAEFERVGGGHVLNNSPYDLAAAALCLSEGGAVVSDASGRPLDDRPLLGSGAGFQMSVIASANAELHAKLLDEVERGIARVLYRGMSGA
ncbi:MAG TPA: inositol monophosphatase family protein [Solirubrobacteraceae bacterium]|nr:inositol monophosphatase family protein [Solirubrobacteraceae bacterium]